MEVAQVIRKEFPGRTLSGIGGIESGNDAAQFILLGCDTVQVCTYVMKVGYRCIHDMCERTFGLHGSATTSNRWPISKGTACSISRRTTIWSHRQAEARKAKAAASKDGKVMRADNEWRGDDFVKQTDALARG